MRLKCDSHSTKINTETIINILYSIEKTKSQYFI